MQILPPPITKNDFDKVLARQRPTVSKSDLEVHERFTQEFGEEGWWSPQEKEPPKHTAGCECSYYNLYCDCYCWVQWNLSLLFSFFQWVRWHLYWYENTGLLPWKLLVFYLGKEELYQNIFSNDDLEYGMLMLCYCNLSLPNTTLFSFSSSFHFLGLASSQ